MAHANRTELRLIELHRGLHMHKLQKAMVKVARDLLRQANYGVQTWPRLR